MVPMQKNYQKHDFFLRKIGLFLITAFCSLEQPKQKRQRGFSLPAFKVAIGGSKSVEKTILQQRPLGATS